MPTLSHPSSIKGGQNGFVVELKPSGAAAPPRQPRSGAGCRLIDIFHASDVSSDVLLCPMLSFLSKLLNLLRLSPRRPACCT